MQKQKFVKLYDEYAPRIYRFVALKVNSRQDSEDIASEVFFKFWQNFGRTKKKIKSPRALLYKIASNTIVDFYRKKPQAEVKIDPTNNSVLSKTQAKTDLNKEVGLNLDMIKIKTALNKLKEEYQNIIIWRYLDDYSACEIARILNKSEGSVRVLTHRALRALKKKL